MSVLGGIECPKVQLYDKDFADLSIEYELEYLEPHIGTVTFPGCLDERFEPIGETWPDIDNVMHRTEKGFRFIADVRFTGVDTDAIRELTKIRNHARAKGIFRFYPHKDKPAWYICLLSPEDAKTEKRIPGDIGYQDIALRFIGIRPFDNILLEADGWYFCDVEEGGYSAAEISYFCDVEELNYNTAVDNVTFFNDTGMMFAKFDGVERQIAQVY